MPALLRGRVYWADLDPVRGHEQAGRRPVLVLSSSRSNRRSQMAVVLPLTSSPPKVESKYAVRLKSVEMRLDSWVLPRQIRAIAEERVDEFVGRVSNEELRKIVTTLLDHFLPANSSVAIGDYPGLA